MKKKQSVFRPTGEVRQPQQGEWYLANKNVFYVSNPFCEYPKSDIYSAVEEVIDVPLWRQEQGQCYWYCGNGFQLLTETDTDTTTDISRYAVGNYFQDGIEASNYADLIKFVLIERLLDNPEFCKVIEKLKGEPA